MGLTPSVPPGIVSAATAAIRPVPLRHVPAAVIPILTTVVAIPIKVLVPVTLFTEVVVAMVIGAPAMALIVQLAAAAIANVSQVIIVPVTNVIRRKNLVRPAVIKMNVKQGIAMVVSVLMENVRKATGFLG